VACRLEISAQKTILICEDDSNLRTLVRLALGDGYRFLEAADGQMVVELARSARPDLIVLDLMLPGKSGFDVLSDLRREQAVGRTPVVVMSAWSHSDVAVINAGADRFVPKPFDPEELRNIVMELLGGDERAS
jgi:two-component system OmpR family response regulator